MKTAWHDIWGSARGPVRRLAPQTRIVCGVCAFTACLVAPASTVPGTGAIIVCGVLWVALCRPRLKIVGAAFAFGLVVLLPYFLLAPIIRYQEPSRGWSDALAGPWAVVLHGIATMQVTIATVTTLTASDLRRGLIRLPVPRIMTAVLLQIVQQTYTILYETRRIAAAIAVRGGSVGFRTGLRVVMSLPSVWLPRIIERAERVAAAMEVRGYCRRDLRAMGSVAASRIDAVAVGLSILGLAGVIALRLWGTG